MPLLLKNRVLETCTSPGTGSVTLLGAGTGYQSFNTAYSATSSTVYYTIADQGGPNWEIGVGTFTPTATLSRDTVLSSSAGGTTKVNFSSGTQDVWVDYPSEKAVIVNDLGDVLVNQSTDQGTGVLQVTGQSTFNGVVVDKSLNLQGGNNLIYPSIPPATGGGLYNTPNNGTGTANSIASPDGTTTATLLTCTTNSSECRWRITTLCVINSIYTNTVYVKQGSAPFAFMRQIFNNGGAASADGAWFNLTTGAVATKGTSVTSSNIQSVGNGWFRISMTSSTAGTITNNLFDFGLCNADALLNCTSGQTAYYWGAQLELGSVASNYTPTTTAAVTTTNNINVPSGQVLAGNGSVSLPSYSFGTSTGTGMGWDGANYFASTGGVVRGYWNSNGLNLNTNQIFILSSTGAITFSPDTTLARDAANTLAQRNSTNAQTFRLYNSFTDSSNYERLGINWSSNTATIQTENAGTGTRRALAFGQDVTINTVTVGLGGGAVSSNTAVGNGAMATTATGNSNVGVGISALKNLSSGNNNLALGANVLYYNTTGSQNLALGSSAMNLNTTGSNSVAIGYNALVNNISGGTNICVGGLSLSNNTTASNLTAVGYQTLNSNTTNVATLGTITGGTGYTNGTYTGVVMTLSSGSTAITYPTATIVVSGGAVTSVTLTSNGVGFKDTTTVLTAPAASIGGTGSGFTVPVATLQSGTSNTAVGYQAGYSNSVGIQNTFTGYQAGYANTTGSYNFFGGYLAGYANTTGQLNSFAGYNAGAAITSGVNNSFFGAYSGLVASTSSNSVGIGYLAANKQTTGNNIVAIGANAGVGAFPYTNANTTGSNNTYLGYQTVGSANNNTNEMVIGYQAVGLGSNTTVIGNTSTTLTQTYGVTKSTNYTVATLPSASTSGVGARAFVTDALSPVFGATVVTGGAVATPVYSDGTNWKVG